MIQALPALNPIPENIEDELRRLLQYPGEPALEAWLFDLVRSSGHMSTSDDLQWRLLCLVWLAAEFDVDKAWPYLMWLNMKEPVISAHLSQLLIDAVDNLNAHLQMAHWLANLKDERLATFFKDFQPIPAQRQVQPLLTSMVDYATHPTVGVWLAAFCEGTRYHDSTVMRSWRLLAAAWYAAGFNPERGLVYLQELTNGAEVLSPADNKLLMDAAAGTGSLTTMIQMMADCSDPAVKAILKDFGHPDLPTLAETILQGKADYDCLAGSVSQAAADVETFKRNLAYLEQGEVSTNTAAILDLACGPLASQTLLLNSAGYKTLGLDLDIPPAYLPLANFKQWFKRRRHHQAWQKATAAYYEALAQQANLKLKWGKVKIKLADLTRLDLDDDSFDVVICAHHLQHAPNVEGLLSEAARVLKPGGLFLADIRPYAALTGAFQANFDRPWSHLRENSLPELPCNKWRERQYRVALEKYFTLEAWLPETDPQAQARLTPEVRAELEGYNEEELTRAQIVVVGRK
jgi:SAM-dependent methyltransferase